MKKRILLPMLLAVCCVSSTFLFAHEFWLMPTKFKVKINELFALTFYVGEDFMGEVWENRKERTLKLTHFTGKNQKDLTDLAIKSDTDDIVLSFANEGTHLLAMESKNSFIALDAEKFNAYLIDDGIDNIYELRKKNGDLDKPSQELYRRCSKTLIQVGAKTGKTFKINTGMPLEIIPLQNPYTAKMGDIMIAKVLFNGKPLKNKMVVTWNKTMTTKTRQQKLKTNKHGQVSFSLDQRGQWMISTVQMIPLINNSEGNYQSYWGNLTFELQ